jgi:hypothetical protein
MIWIGEGMVMGSGFCKEKYNKIWGGNHAGTRNNPINISLGRMVTSQSTFGFEPCNN